ncbi:hypothetical protein Rleg4DRAFT_7640 [Rhizobium leguminosarum bv. trifolii WSM2297]|uniref:Uncharacterized protein n=1 Tax=Rhizobium leguminosarum bv. trifolii WSM2297 TaxID=754762 RepID=J0WIR7_RHILT|nr:hypothetical protein Rleg4DRAFT_7251 [Rhizobium leguminosarum bv. trifolii WSM2297]EJC85748.1 hypothetical protein Rleg4DRAFT_7640 [Rhizobium leguminosarum bv. trifolii WSM2297]
MEIGAARKTSMRQVERGSEVTHRRAAVITQRLVAGDDAGQHRQIVARRDQPEDRCRVVLAVIDRAALGEGEMMKAGMRLPGPQRSAFGGAT